MSVQVKSSYYHGGKYQSLERFISYYYQFDAVRKTPAKTILFIGVGDGIVPDFLKKNPMYQVTTMDFDKDLKPDVVGDIKALPFQNKTFDLICAFEILEHLPYKDSLIAINELARVAKENVIVSVPHRRTGFEFIIKFPFIRSLFKKDFLRLAIRFPVRFKGFAFSGQHYWEIDGRTTKLKDFRRDLSKKFEIQSEQTPVLDFYRRFFLMKVK